MLADLIRKDTLATTTTESGRVTIRPHRSYRTLRVSRISWLASVVTLPVGVMLAYATLLLGWPRATAWVSAIVLHGTPVKYAVQDNFLWIGSTVPVPYLPALSVIGALDVAGVCVAILVVAGALRKQSPLPLWVMGNVLVLLFTALWAFFEGRVAYDGPTYMLLVERTSVIMILCAPIFSVIVSALLPFNVVERGAMFVMLIGMDFGMSVLRLAAFALLLTRFGVLAEANLYLFFGPLIDVVYFIVGYSLCVVSLSRRIARSEQVWEWL